MDSIVYYSLAIILLILSFVKDKKKTLSALKKAWKSFENILPQLLTVLIIIGFLLAILNPETISLLIGSKSGFWGVILAAIIGSITLIPGFVAFPMAAMLVEHGAGLTQIGAFVSTLMMVGIVTMPVEIKYFGKKVAILRNLVAFIFSFFVALVIQLVTSLSFGG